MDIKNTKGAFCLKKFVSLFVTLIIMIIIFLFSHQPAASSTSVSSNVHNCLDNVGFLQQLFLIFPIRKCAHFFIYFLLGISTFFTIRALKLKTYLSIPFCVLYACTDEFHQTFVYGRSGELRDVLIDSTGSFVGILTMYFMIYIINHIITNRKKDCIKQSHC